MEEQKISASDFIYRRLTKQQQHDYIENGYCQYGSILTDEGLACIFEECMQAWSAEKGPFDPNATWLQNALLPNIHHRSDTVRRFYFSGPLVNVAEQIIGPNIKGVTSQLTFKMRGDTKTFGWHQDNGYGQLDPYNAITCLIALDVVDEQNGCLWLIPGSHKCGQIQVGDLGILQEREKRSEIAVAVDVVDEGRAVPILMQPGECLFFHCWTLHRSLGNFSNHDRRILLLRYADADAVEVKNNRVPRLGRLLRGQSRFPEVQVFEYHLSLV